MKKVIYFCVSISLLLSLISCSKLFPTLAENDMTSSLTPGDDADYIPPEELTDVFLKEVVDNYYGYTDKDTGDLHYYRFSSDGRKITHSIVSEGNNETVLEEYEYVENIGATQAYYEPLVKAEGDTSQVKVILMESYYVMYMDNIALVNLRGYLGYDPDDPFYEGMEPETVTYIEKMKGKSFTFRGLLSVYTYKFDKDGISIDYYVQMDGKELVKKATYTLDSIIDDYNATFTGDGSKGVKFIANDDYTELYINDKNDSGFKGYLKDTYTVHAMPNFKGKTYIKSGSDVTLFFTANGEQIRYWNGTSIFYNYSFDSDAVATRDGNNFKAKFGGYNLEVSPDASTIKYDGATYNLQSIAAPGDSGVTSELKDSIKNQKFGSAYEVSADGETIHWTDGMQIHYFYTFVKETGISLPEGYKQAIYKEPGGNYYGVSYDEENKRIKMSSGFGYSSMDDVVYNGSWASSVPAAPEFRPYVANKTFVSANGARYVFSDQGNNIKIGLDNLAFVEDFQKSGDYFRAKYGSDTVEFDEANNAVRISSKDSRWYTYAYNTSSTPSGVFKNLVKGKKYRNGENKYEVSVDGSSITWTFLTLSGTYTYFEDRPSGNGTKRAVYYSGTSFYMVEMTDDMNKLKISEHGSYVSVAVAGDYYDRIIDAQDFFNIVKGKSYRHNSSAVTLYFSADGKTYRGWDGMVAVMSTTWGGNESDVSISGNDSYYSANYNMTAKKDSTSINIPIHGNAVFNGTYTLITTPDSSFKDNIKGLSFEGVYKGNTTGDIIEYDSTFNDCFYVFVSDAPDSPDGYKRAIYQKPKGGYYGVELIIGNGYKLISMGDSSSGIGNVSYSATYFINGTPPEFKSKVANKVFIDSTTEARYVFNSDGTVATWGNDLAFQSDNKPDGKNITATYGGTSFEYDAINNKVKSGKDGKWYSYAYSRGNIPASSFKPLVQGGEYRKGTDKYVFSDDASSVKWNSTTYYYVEDRSDGAGTKRAVYKNGNNFYMAEVTSLGNKLRMANSASYNSTTFNGTYYLKYETFKQRVAGKTFEKGNLKYVFDADSNLKVTSGTKTYSYTYDKNGESDDGLKCGYYYGGALPYWCFRLSDDLTKIDRGTTGWAWASATLGTLDFTEEAFLVNP